MFKIGIDVGGTFSDFVMVKHNESPRYFKMSSSPDHPSLRVMGNGGCGDGYGMRLKDLRESTEMVTHGTTVAANTLM